MSDFDIEFEDAPTSLPEAVRVAYGCINIGTLRERFEASLEFWTLSDYRSHWQRSIQRIADRHDKSCLITSLTEPKSANFLQWWPIYRIGERAHFQNQILFLNEIRGGFDPNDPYQFVRDRMTISADGSPISEWSVPVSSLLWFLKGGDKGLGRDKRGRNSFLMPVGLLDPSLRSG
jgi:hypothetical protein